MTELARKLRLDTRTVIILVLMLLVCALFAYYLMWGKPKTNVQFPQKGYIGEYARTAEARSKGLSGRESLADHSAMVFVFDAQAERCFWMKDMRFAIDIVWLDSKKHVTAVEKNIQPSTYPSNFCHNGQYVVELKAGQADIASIRVGDPADLL